MPAFNPGGDGPAPVTHRRRLGRRRSVPGTMRPPGPPCVAVAVANSIAFFFSAPVAVAADSAAAETTLAMPTTAVVGICASLKRLYGVLSAADRGSPDPSTTS